MAEISGRWNVSPVARASLPTSLWRRAVLLYDPASELTWSRIDEFTVGTSTGINVPGSRTKRMPNLARRGNYVTQPIKPWSPDYCEIQLNEFVERNVEADKNPYWNIRQVNSDIVTFLPTTYENYQDDFIDWWKGGTTWCMIFRMDYVAQQNGSTEGSPQETTFSWFNFHSLSDINDYGPWLWVRHYWVETNPAGSMIKLSFDHIDWNNSLRTENAVIRNGPRIDGTNPWTLICLSVDSDTETAHVHVNGVRTDMVSNPGRRSQNLTFPGIMGSFISNIDNVDYAWLATFNGTFSDDDATALHEFLYPRFGQEL